MKTVGEKCRYFVRARVHKDRLQEAFYILSVGTQTATPQADDQAFIKYII